MNYNNSVHLMLWGKIWGMSEILYSPEFAEELADFNRAVRTLVYSDEYLRLDRGSFDYPENFLTLESQGDGFDHYLKWLSYLIVYFHNLDPSNRAWESNFSLRPGNIVVSTPHCLMLSSALGEPEKVARPYEKAVRGLSVCGFDVGSTYLPDNDQFLMGLSLVQLQTAIFGDGKQFHKKLGFVNWRDVSRHILEQMCSYLKQEAGMNVDFMAIQQFPDDLHMRIQANLKRRGIEKYDEEYEDKYEILNEKLISRRQNWANTNGYNLRRPVGRMALSSVSYSFAYLKFIDDIGVVDERLWNSFDRLFGN